MTEKIQIIAAVLGIIGAVWTFVRFVFTPYFRRNEEFKEILALVFDYFGRWKALGYSLGKGTLIPDDKFMIVNKYRTKFKNQEQDLKSFLLRNAIQYGQGGCWGLWLDMNKDNPAVLPTLILALNTSAGQRPAWRSAFILEKIYRINPLKMQAHFKIKNKLDINQKYFLNLIQETKVEKEWYRLYKKMSSEEKEKFAHFREELSIFSDQVNDFAKKQTII